MDKQAETVKLLTVGEPLPTSSNRRPTVSDKEAKQFLDEAARDQPLPRSEGDRVSPVGYNVD